MSKYDSGVQINLSWVYASTIGAMFRPVEAGPGIYVARRTHGQDIIPGKCVSAHGKIYISCENKEWPYSDGEILCDTSLPQSPVSYAWQRGKEGKIPKRAIAGGRTSHGDTLYVIRCQINGEWVAGKFHEGHQYGHFPYGGEEKHITDYEFLVYNKD